MILAIPLLLVWLILSVTMIAVIAHTRLKLWGAGRRITGNYLCNRMCCICPYTISSYGHRSILE